MSGSSNSRGCSGLINLYQVIDDIILNYTKVQIMTRKHYTPEFKRDTANLVLKQGYTVIEASKAVGASVPAIRKWTNQLKSELDGVTPDIGAISPDKQEFLKKSRLLVKDQF